jgi:DNA-binding response OmpR family regulator
LRFGYAKLSPNVLLCIKELEQQAVGNGRPLAYGCSARFPGQHVVFEADGDGVDFLRTRRKLGADVPIIAVTARGEEEQRIEGLRAGADDYVVKPFSIVELDARVEAVGRRRLGPSVLDLEVATVDMQAFTFQRDGKNSKLLQKEAELLDYLSENPGVTFRRSDLLRRVWGYDAAPTIRTVDTHVFKLRKKLELKPENPRHLITVHGVGYRFEP